MNRDLFPLDFRELTTIEQAWEEIRKVATINHHGYFYFESPDDSRRLSPALKIFFANPKRAGELMNFPAVRRGAPPSSPSAG